MVVFMDYNAVPWRRWHMRMMAMVVWARMPHSVVWMWLIGMMWPAKIVGKWG
jgi:hypothetical protein